MSQWCVYPTVSPSQFKLAAISTHSSRPETAAAVSYLVQSLLAAKAKLAEEKSEQAHAPRRGKNKKRREMARMRAAIRVFDLCCGSGCIPLLFWHEFYSSAAASQMILPQLEMVGFDASSDAIQLARENHAMIEPGTFQLGDSMRTTAINRRKSTLSLQSMKFLQANVLRRNSSPEELRDLMTLRQAIGQHFKEQLRSKTILKNVKDNDIWISNPPYISPEDYIKTTSQSVRDFEPRTALVPPETSTTRRGIAPRTGNEGDWFYQDILGQAMEMRAKVVLFEVADMDQAKRVAQYAVQQRHWHIFEIWRDAPTSKAPMEYLPYDDKVISIQGAGEGRSVLICTRDGAELVGREHVTKEKLPDSVRVHLHIPYRKAKADSILGALKGTTRKEREELAEQSMVSKERMPPAERKLPLRVALRRLPQQQAKEKKEKKMQREFKRQSHKSTIRNEREPPDRMSK
jgi:methylase of polypeptide subunit release factors